MSKCYVAYEDRGPSGPCGQITSVTRTHNDLYIFDDETSARLFVDKVEKCRPTSRLSPRITGFWSEEHGNLFDETNRKE